VENSIHDIKWLKMGKNNKKIEDFHRLSTEIHKVFHKVWINIFIKIKESLDVAQFF